MKLRPVVKSGIFAPSVIAVAALFVLMGLAVRAGAQPKWRIELVVPGSTSTYTNIGKFPSLVIDREGNFHLAYFNDNRNALWYAYRGKDDKQWYRMEVDSKAGSFVSLAVDAEGRPYFAYNSIYETGLHYAHWDGKVWRKQVIDPIRTGYYTSIQVDGGGHPKISYYFYHHPDNSYALQLKYAYFDGTAWFIETVEQRSHTGKFNSLALDASGHPHISYSEVRAGDLRYANWDGSEWRFSTPDPRSASNSYVGTGNSIALDASGNPHIAYFDGTKRRVKYAWRQDGRWVTEVVDQQMGQNETDRVSLVLDSQNRPHIAFYDSGMGALKYAVRIDQKWHLEVVDQDGNVGKFPSLCLDARGEPHLAYYGLDDGSIRIAHREQGPPSTAAVQPPAKP